jgi:hypothetical protein
MRPRPDDAPAARAALQAARAARAAAGDEAAAGDDARRDAFAALLYGVATAFAARDDGPDAPPLDERVDALATRVLRDALGLGFRDACRGVEAIADSIVAERPDPAVIGLVREGAACAADWMGGDLRAFESRVLRATAPDGFASERALRARR